MDKVMVKMWIDGDCVALTTYCRRHGRRGRFLLILKEMQEWLLEDYGEWTLMDEDCGNVISLHVSGGTVYVQTWWLSAYGLDDVQGFSQRFSLPVETLRTLLCNETPIRYLYIPKPQNSHIVTEYASEVIRRVSADKLTRRALSKAMRDCFHWKGEIVTLHPNGRNSFYFTTAFGRRPLCGGLILHETSIHTPAGEKPKFYYGIHT